MKPTRLAALLAMASFLAPSSAWASCGAAFCSVNSNWTIENAQAEAGSIFDLRYELMHLDQPYHGSDAVAVGQVRRHHDEVSTMNRNLLLSWTRNFANGWGVSVSLPVTDRVHDHLHNHHGKQFHDHWDSTRLGDARVLARRELLPAEDPLHPATAGITFGLKLPTGSTKMADRGGNRAERSMQPGTGTTDLLLGGYAQCRLTEQDLSAFIQLQHQAALNSHANYRPGHQTGLDLGVRKGVSERVGVLLQLNLVHKGRDKGSEAEPADTGGRYVYASPGLSFALPHNLQLYGFYQHPLYRDVNGVQLTARRGLVLGLAGRM
jgi:hypothetical protein